MSQFFLFPTAVRREPDIDLWFDERAAHLAVIGRSWFDVMRSCGDDVRELLHDYHPTACVGQAAFGYVNIFTSHVNVGFFRGAELADPAGLLQGTGKFMRHTKLRPDETVNEDGLRDLIVRAYTDMKGRVRAEEAISNE